MADQANGAVVVKYGDTMMLATAVASEDVREDTDFLPLRADFEEKMYAVGKIPGGFFRREGRPTEAATLVCRIIDRPVRPLLPSGLRNDVQIVATALSADYQNEPVLAAIIGASAALSISDIPFAGPHAAVKVGRINGQFILNPSYAQLDEGDLDLLVVGTKDALVTVEMEGDQVAEDVLVDGIIFGHQQLIPICEAIEELTRRVGQPKREYFIWEPDPEVAAAVTEMASDDLRAAVRIGDKKERDARLREVQQRVHEALQERFPDKKLDVAETMEQLIKKHLQSLILDERYRPGGRGFDELRPITCEVGLLPRAHGSGLFTRGGTQVLTVTTLGATRDKQIIRGLTEEEESRFMHQYNFPPYSTGEAKPMRGPGRREIGHGALAEKALERMLPPEEDFPYTIRLVSEVLASNGSSSMASVCAASLALMDAGVPIREPVAGVAMGLIKGEDRHAILTDIQGIEDMAGHMDFKVAGTRNGVNALHLDIKVKGISAEILREALEQARTARLQILETMQAAIDRPRGHLSPYAPQIFSLRIDRDKIGLLIGPGGKTIRKIQEDCNVEIDVEDDGTVFVTARDSEGGQRARQIIESMTKEVEVGEVYVGKVVKTTPFGAFVEILPGQEGLVHISQLAWEHVEKTEDVLRAGDEVQVKVIEKGDDGKIRLSRKALLDQPRERPKPYFREKRRS
jgi:polyribonucleotide nucleotidyltransferase